MSDLVILVILLIFGIFGSVFSKWIWLTSLSLVLAVMSFAMVIVQLVWMGTMMATTP